LHFCVPSRGNAIGYAMHGSRSADAVIRVYDAVGKVIEAHKHKGSSKSGEVSRFFWHR